jgi:hypothetical protein
MAGMKECVKNACITEGLLVLGVTNDDVGDYREIKNPYSGNREWWRILVRQSSWQGRYWLGLPCPPFESFHQLAVWLQPHEQWLIIPAGKLTEWFRQCERQKADVRRNSQWIVNYEIRWERLIISKCNNIIINIQSYAFGKHHSLLSL